MRTCCVDTSGEDEPQTEAERLLAETPVASPSFAGAVSAAVFTTAAFRFMTNALIALLAVRTSVLPSAAAPVFLLLFVNLAVILSTAFFYVASTEDFRAAAHQRAFRHDRNAMGDLFGVVLATSGFGDGSGLKAAGGLAFALYIDSSVYLVSVVSLHLALQTFMS